MIDAASISSSQSVLSFDWIVPSYSHATFDFKFTLVHQPHRYSKYTLQEREEAKKNEVLSADESVTLNADPEDNSSTVTPGKEADVISSLSSRIALDNISTSSLMTPTEFNSAQQDDDIKIIATTTEDWEVPTVAEYNGIFAHYLQEDYKHPSPRVCDVIKNRLQRARMACRRLCRRLFRKCKFTPRMLFDYLLSNCKEEKQFIPRFPK